MLRKKGKDILFSSIFSLLFLSLNPLIASVPESLKTLPKDEANKVLPANIFKLNKFYSKYIMLVEKSTHRLYLYKNNDSYPEFVRSFVIATGKNSGDKLSLGDRKTPEGVYQFTNFVSKSDLYVRYGEEGAIYGAGAFVMNYPNPIDVAKGKTGGGIWLHSTNDNSRIAKGQDSRGCVVVVDKDLIEIGKYIELNKTPIVVVQDLNLLKESTWQQNRVDLESLIQKWSKAWATENIEQYMSFYHPDQFISKRGGYESYKTYKKQVFWSKGKPKINLSSYTILASKDYAFIQFQQDYASKNIRDIGRKTLYLKKDTNYKWKIVSEIWNKLPKSNDKDIVSIPSNRFFRE